MAESPNQSVTVADDALPFTLPARVPPHNEGHTVAAWFAMILIMVGTATGCVGVCSHLGWLVVVGVVVVLCGVVGGLLLRAAGHGQKTAH